MPWQKVVLTEKRFALVIASGFFCVWLAILYAGADHPPPPGFVLLIVLDLAAAGGVYVRIPTYVRWSRTRRSHRLLLAVMDGLAAGLLIALVTQLTPIGGEPSVEPGLMAYVIWYAVLGAVGAANAVFIYALSVLFSKRDSLT